MDCERVPGTAVSLASRVWITLQGLSETRTHAPLADDSENFFGEAEASQVKRLVTAKPATQLLL